MNVKRLKLGIKTQIFLGFLLFTIIIAVLLWVFQIIFLDSFYKTIKHNEIENTAESISQELDASYNVEFLEYLKGITKNTNTEIMITDEKGSPLIKVTTGISEFFSELTPAFCASIYERVSADTGYYSEWSENTGELVYIKTITSMDDESTGIMIVLNTLVVPVDATVDTLTIQLVCLTIVMIILSTLLAFFLSRKISRPLMNINEGAKKLALGEYSIQFVPKGSRETFELATTLNITANELSNVENLRRELIANVSHDLRTPLTMIAGYAEVMRDIPGENSPENVQVIIDESQRLTNLVNDLLDLSKLEAGKANFSPEVMNLTESIRNILTRYVKLADYNFDFYHGEDIFVNGDDIKISQVVYNLVNNAINYTGEDKLVTLIQSVEDGFVKIEVCDTGVGIPESKLNAIWDRYYKLDEEHKRAQVGTGLGLSIVKKVIELHNGYYGVSSIVGQGSTFWFSLPIYTEEKAE
ncbi:MAG: HAMP domain-containing sensor histidine kinase [Clostridia bacterium]